MHRQRTGDVRSRINGLVLLVYFALKKNISLEMQKKNTKDKMDGNANSISFGS